MIGNQSKKYDHTVNTRPYTPVSNKRSTLAEEMVNDDGVYLQRILPVAR